MLATQIEINGDDIAKKEKIETNKTFIEQIHVISILKEMKNYPDQ